MMLLVAAFAMGAQAAGKGGILYPYDTNAWGKKSKICKHGTSQSPIDLPLTDNLQNDRIILMKNSPTVRQRSLTLSAYGGKTTGGHGLGFAVPPGFQMETPETKRTYDLLQFHAHTGSEHFVDGYQYAAEIHYVHSRTAQPISLAREDGDLAVIGVFFDVWDGKGQRPRSIRYMAKLLKSMKCKTDEECDWVHREDQKVPCKIRFDPTIFIKLAAAHSQHKFWTYSGGLTTPGCAEIVSWHVYMNPLYITQEQLDTLNALQGREGNYRPPKPLNGRAIAPLNWQESWFNGPRQEPECERGLNEEDCEALGDTCSWDGSSCVECRSLVGESKCNSSPACTFCPYEKSCLPSNSERLCACASGKMECRMLAVCDFRKGYANNAVGECHVKELQ